jgi:hypothetical protein
MLPIMLQIICNDYLFEMKVLNISIVKDTIYMVVYIQYTNEKLN